MTTYYSRLVILALTVCSGVGADSAAASDEFRVLKGWTFDKPGDLQGWRPGGLKDLKVADGALQAAPSGSDPILTSPKFELQANAFQYVRVLMRCAAAGTSEFFYSNTTEGKYGGFSSKKQLNQFLRATPDFVVQRFYPFWGPEKKIVHIRLDPPNTGPFAIRSIQIVEVADRRAGRTDRWDFTRDTTGLAPGGVSPPLKATPEGTRITTSGARPAFQQYLQVDTSGREYVAVRMASDRPGTARLSYALSGTLGLQTYTFPVRGDGRVHAYILEPGARHAWTGQLVYLALEPLTQAGAQVTLQGIALESEPAGPPDVAIRYFGVTDTLPRAGRPATLTCSLFNQGGPYAGGWTAELQLPAGVRAKGPAKVAVAPIPYAMDQTLTWQIESDGPIQGQASLRIAGAPEPLSATCRISLAPALSLPKTDYVPPPVPVKTSRYQVGVYYFPGWQNATRWSPLQAWQNRKPALGWYAEGSPEVADWQIKWMLEHGISWIAYDWYWNKGARHLEHGLHDAFFQARYQHLINFCLLYANHNPAGSTSVADSLALTQYWIDNYFKRPNYLRVDNKPVMIIFSPHRISDDVGHEGVRPMFQKMDALCREHGIPGIYMVACARGDAESVRRLQEEGYQALSGYNYAGVSGMEGNMHPYTLLAQNTENVWNQVADAGLLKEIPVLAGGWDPRPWHGPEPRFFYPDRTPQAFADHCRAAKQFLDTRDRDPKLCLVEAWNEWGEGSYIEPHAEYGFGYLDAVREVFAPSAGPHEDWVPADVGLGPYDVPPMVSGTDWQFNRPGDSENWSGAMQIRDLRAEGGCLKLTAAGNDPALSSPPLEIEAAKYRAVAIRMKASRDEHAQLFWATTSMPVSGPNSVSFAVRGDGQFHDYEVKVAENRRWRGIIKSLRFDPGSHPDTQFEIDSIRLVPR